MQAVLGPSLPLREFERWGPPELPRNANVIGAQFARNGTVTAL
jgi:hypothetical protein